MNFYFLPQKLISKFNTDKANDTFVVPLKKNQQNKIFMTESQQQLFYQICKYYEHIQWNNGKDLVHSGFLNFDVTKTQQQLFNWTFKNVLTGFIMYNVQSEGENKKLVRCQIDAIEGNVQVYEQLQNDGGNRRPQRFGYCSGQYLC